MNNIENINVLAKACEEDSDLEECIEEMFIAAGKYVSAVLEMETISKNYPKRKGTEYRDAIEESDKMRTIAHNAFISKVDIVNRICGTFNISPVYDGGPERRCYGDFAFELAASVFQNRV